MNSRFGLIMDKLLMACSILYITLPVVIFFGGWLNYYYAVVLSLLFTFFACSLYTEFSPVSIIGRDTAKFWLVVLACMALWVFLSGIGGVTYQNWDLIFRKPIYRDLCGYDWPVIYDNSSQNEAVHEIIGEGTTLFSYYFSWWLVPALMSKLFQFGEPVRNFVLSLWAFLGVFLSAYNLCRYFRKTSFIIPAVFIFFSGLDIAGYIVHNRGFMAILMSHMEWWAKYFQYSANTTQLFWVFNQSIPTWLIVVLLLQLHDSKNQLALSSLTFAYSPWAAMGIIPVALTAAVINNRKVNKIFSAQNILIPLAMLVVYGAFYMLGNGSRPHQGGFTLTDSSRVIYYIFFVFLEFGIYFITMGKTATGYRFYYIVLAELLLFPCYIVFTKDFIRRASIPALFIMMTFLMKFLLDGNHGTRKAILVIAMLIGAWTPVNEMNRSASAFAINGLNSCGLLPARLQKHVRELRREEIYSFGHIRTTQTGLINTYKYNYSAYDFQDSFFFKYLAK